VTAPLWGVGFLVYGAFPTLGGSAVLKRTDKRLMGLNIGILAVVWGALALAGLHILGVLIHLGFGITAVLLLPQQAHELKKARRSDRRPGP
jgi:hypothetical protein